MSEVEDDVVDPDAMPFDPDTSDADKAAENDDYINNLLGLYRDDADLADVAPDAEVLDQGVLQGDDTHDVDDAQILSILQEYVRAPPVCCCGGGICRAVRACVRACVHVCVPGWDCRVVWCVCFGWHDRASRLLPWRGRLCD